MSERDESTARVREAWATAERFAGHALSGPEKSLVAYGYNRGVEDGITGALRMAEEAAERFNRRTQTGARATRNAG